LYFVHILFSLYLLVFEGVPVDQMSPEAFTVMENVSLFGGYFITSNIIPRDVFIGDVFGIFHVGFDEPEGGAGDECT
jgi:hypothetical protein